MVVFQTTNLYIYFDEPQDIYLLDASNSKTSMMKYEDDAMELIKMVTENSHHNVKNVLEGVFHLKEG